MESFTVTQKERISELGGGPELMEQTFESSEERNKAFRELEKKLVRECRAEMSLKSALILDRNLPYTEETEDMVDTESIEIL